MRSISTLMRKMRNDVRRSFMRFFYYAYIPLILYLGFRTVDYRAFFGNRPLK